MANRRWFTRFANAASRFAGSPLSFVLALLVVLAWIVTGPLFGFSVTFLMVFLIQNSQNRDARALQIKLDELIRATRGAHNSLLDLEELEERELQTFQDRYEALARRARECDIADDDNDVGTPEVAAPPDPAQPR